MNYQALRGKDSIPENVKEMIEVICPYCSKKYKRELFWTGQVKPRIYCKECEWMRTRTYKEEEQ